MTDLLAYHTVARALEAEHGWTADRRFAAAVAHAVEGHLPYGRHYAAGRERAREGIGEDGVGRLVRDFFETDINPAGAFISALRHPASVFDGFNAYNASASLGVRTSVPRGDLSKPGGRRFSASRALLAQVDDPVPCRIATLSFLDAALDHVQSGGTCLARPSSLSHLAEILGMGHGAAADVARAIEDDWLAPVADLPRKLGCHKRTLERRLKEVGLTAQAIRQADRMMRATAGLFSGDSLTSVALDCGFADAAHMSRAFRGACGMAPSTLAAIARQDRELSGMGPRLRYQRPHRWPRVESDL